MEKVTVVYSNKVAIRFNPVFIISTTSFLIRKTGHGNLNNSVHFKNFPCNQKDISYYHPQASQYLQTDFKFSPLQLNLIRTYRVNDVAAFPQFQDNCNGIY